MLLCGLFLYACDALVNSGDASSNPSLPGGEKNLEMLTETQWISLPDQFIEGKKPEEATSWYTFKLAERLDDNQYRFQGRHFFIKDEYPQHAALGNRYGVTFQIDSDGNKTIAKSPLTTFMGVPIYENASFLFINDWVITTENGHLGHLIVKYSQPHLDEIFLFGFEPLTEEHILYEEIIGHDK